MSPLSSLVAVAVVLGVTTAASVAAAAEPFSYDPPGTLVIGSGKGRSDKNVYVPGMRFPIESGPAFANSQVYGHGGGSGPGGSQCDKENFSYPWHDNYCESRSWDMPLCPSGSGHQGQDIRAASCVKGVHWTVAAVDGTITSIGSYSVYLTASDGTRFDYLHQSDVQVKEGQKVKRGERIGKVSNQFGGEATTVHLHFNIKQNVAGVGSVYVPGYVSLIKSYESLLGINQPDASAPEAGPPVTAKPPTLAEAPVTQTDPTEPEPAPAADSDDGGCAAQGRAPTSSTTTVAALGLVALATIASRRRRSR